MRENKAGDLARKELDNVKAYKPGRPIEEVKRELRLKTVIKMASNENPLSPSPYVVRAIAKSLKNLNRYPDGSSYYLKTALSKKFGMPSDCIILGNGSDELITFAIRAFADAGDEVIIAKPTFLIYEIAAQAHGVKIITVPLNNFKYDLKEMARRLTRKTKLVFIANPDNPTGTYVTKNEVREFMDCVGDGTIVFFDEAYYEFASENKDYPETFAYLKKKNVIISRTFSKVYALAGLRIGYAFSNEDIIAAMEKVREPFNVNSIAQTGALAALKDAAFINKTKKLVKEGKKYIYRNLNELGVKYIPSAANFVLIYIGRGAKEVYESLLRAGVIVREMSGWNLGGFIRVTIGTNAENKRFICVLRKIEQIVDISSRKV